MPIQWINKLKSSVDSITLKASPTETSIKILICHQNIWGSDTLVSALKDKNDISRKYWIEQIEIVQYSRAVIDNLIEQSFDLVIIDHNMDKGCLSDLTRKIREIDASVKILIATNVKTTEINQLISKNMIDNVLYVPIQVMPMWQLIDELLNR